MNSYVYLPSSLFLHDQKSLKRMSLPASKTALRQAIIAFDRIIVDEDPHMLTQNDAWAEWENDLDSAPPFNVLLFQEAFDRSDVALKHVSNALVHLGDLGIPEVNKLIELAQWS